MSGKILIADDSVTIQKVVSIMLANEPYELTQCTSEDDFFKNYLPLDFNLILLDYNFSSQTSGDELIKKVLEQKPECKLLVMLGTFDSVDENELKIFGAKDTIVKPFESSIFIKKIDSLINLKEDESESIVINDDIDNNTDDDQGWTVSGPQVEDKSSFEEMVKPDIISSDNHLDDEIESWGISIPGIIGDDGAMDMPEDIPQVIGKSNGVLPSSQNLEYPDRQEKISPSSKMIPVENLAIEPNEDNISIGETTEEIALSKIKAEDWENEISNEQEEDEFWNGHEPAEEKSSIQSESIFKVVPEDTEEELEQNQIVIEKDDVFNNQAASPLDLADAVEKTVVKESNEETSEMNEEFFKDKIKEIITVHYEQDIINRVKEHMGPMLEKYVHEYCKETIEKVTWEIIPDLAENLIKKELKNITESISNK